MANEMHCVLAGAAADFQHVHPVRKAVAQHRENGFLIALAGFREGQHPQFLSLAGVQIHCGETAAVIGVLRRGEFVTQSRDLSLQCRPWLTFRLGSSQHVDIHL
jgi:hypothetical protein